MSKPQKILKGDNCYDLHVMWAIHNKCNYQCNYCPDDLHDGEWSWLKLDKLKGFINKIENHYVKLLNFEEILFSFTGGEPTLWKDFKPFVEYINSKGFRCGLTTNGSVSKKFWVDTSSFFDYICLSFHPYSADLEKFLDVYEYLHNDPNTVIPSVRIMMPPEQDAWDKSKKLLDELKKFPNWTYECVHILKDYGTNSEKIDYEDKEKVSFLENNAFNSQFDDDTKIFNPKTNFNYLIEYDDGKKEKLLENELINSNQNNFNDWNCYIGIEQLFIHHSGDIKTAGCKMGENLGNILFYNEVQFPTKPVLCKTDGCYCPTDVRITKSHKDLELPYEVELKEGQLFKVENINSQIKYRIHADFTNNVIKEKSAIEFINGLKNYIEYIKSSKNLKSSEICLFIILKDISWLNLTQKNILLFQNIECFKSITVYGIDWINKGIAKSIIDTFDVSHYNTFSIKQFKKSKLFFNEIQNQNSKYFSTEHSCQEGEAQSIIKNIKYLKENFKFYNFKLKSPPEDIELNRIINENKSLSFVNQEFVTKRSEVMRINNTLYDKVYKFDNGTHTTLQNYSNNNLKSEFKDWYCDHGHSLAVISDQGEIYSSFCKQNYRIGSLYEDEFALNPDIFTKCNQSQCDNSFNQLTNKFYTDKSKIITKIDDLDNNIKYRILLEITSVTGKDIGLENFFKNVSQYIDKVLENKKLSEKELLININLVDGLDPFDTNKLVDYLSRIKGHKKLLMPVSTNLRKDDVILLLKSFNFINTYSNNIKELVVTKLFLENIKDFNCFFYFEHNLVNSEEAFTFKIIQSYLSDFDLYSFSLNNVSKKNAFIQKLIKPNRSNYFESSLFKEKFSEEIRLNDSFLNKTFHYKYPHGQDEVVFKRNYRSNFENSKCDMGNSISYINKFGEVYTSTCKNKKRVGDIRTLDFNLNQEEFYICNQSQCKNPFDHLSNKTFEVKVL